MSDTLKVGDWVSFLTANSRAVARVSAVQRPAPGRRARVIVAVFDGADRYLGSLTLPRSSVTRIPRPGGFAE